MIAKSILLVDDDELVLRVVSRYFEGHGFRVFTAQSSAEGMEIARSESIQLLILDMLLHENDGYEALAAFHSEFPNLPIVVLTGLLVDEEFDADVAKFGGRACLKKTVSFEELLSVANRLAGPLKPAPAAAAAPDETTDCGEIALAI